MSETVATVKKADGTVKREIIKVRDEDGISESDSGEGN